MTIADELLSDAEIDEPMSARMDADRALDAALAGKADPEQPPSLRTLWARERIANERMRSL